MKKNKAKVIYTLLIIGYLVAFIRYFDNAETCDTRQGHTCSVIEIKEGK